MSADEVTTAAELDALPEEVLLCASGVYPRGGDFTDCWVRPVPHWITGLPLGAPRVWEVLIYAEEPQIVRTEHIRLPVTVLYRPDSPAPQADREALARAIFAAPALIAWDGRAQYDIADYLLSTVLSGMGDPAPATQPVTVTAKKVESAKRWLRDSWGVSPGGRRNFVATNASAITRSLLAELGIEVTR